MPTHGGSCTFEFETNMGEPEVGVRCPLTTSSVHVEGTTVSMGNPHYVILVDDFDDGWQRQAAQIQAAAISGKAPTWNM